MTTRPVSAIVLAADGAARMRSARPKALHLLCGRPMVQYVIDALPRTLVDRIVVVVGDGADLVAKKLGETSADPRVVVVEQRDGWGSGHGALVGLDPFSDDDGDDDILVVAGDIPLVASSVMEQLVAHHRASGASGTVATAPIDSSAAHHRVVTGRNATIEALVGLDEADAADLGTDGAGTGTDGDASVGLYAFRRSLLAPSLRRITADPDSGVFSLGDVVAVLASTGNQVRACPLDDADDLAPVVDRIHLAHAEREIRRRTNEAWMRAGVTMLDPERTYVDATVALAPDVTLFPGTLLQGNTVVGAGAEIGPDTRLVDCAIGPNAVVEKTMGRDAEVGEGARVGPFAVLDPGSHIEAASRTGPFYHASTDESH